MSDKKEKFFDSIPESNIEWAAQQIASQFTDKQFMELQACFAKLDESLYKSWAKDLTLNDLKEAVGMVSELTGIQ